MKMKDLIPVKVECYSGYKADEYPKCYYLDDTRYDITEITDRWYQSDRDPDLPESDYFKIRTAPDMQFILKHELKNDLWYLLPAKI